MPRSAFHRRIALGFMLVLICAALVAGASILALRSVRARTEQLATNYARQLIQVEKLEAVEEASSAAARALLLTNDTSYAERVKAARAEGDELITELRGEIQSGGGQEALREIERLRSEHQKSLDQTIALRQSGAPLQNVSEQWRTLVSPRRDEVAAAIQVLRARKEALHEEALARVEQSSRRLTQLILAMTAVSLLLALVLAFVITRTLVRMYDAETLARQAADDARQWFATTLSSIGDAVIATDNHGKITFINGAAEALTAWNRSDAVGKPLEQVFSIISNKTGQPIENPVKQVLASGVGVQLTNDTVLVARDGKHKPIDDSAAPIRDAARGVTGVVLVFRDISERQRAEAAVRESKEWLATTVHSIGDAVIATDREGHITLMNPVAQKLTGWPEQQALGAPLEAVFNNINEDSRKRLQNPVEKVLATGQVVGLANHTVLVAKDGLEWPLDDSGAPIRDAQGNIIGVVLVFREVTERRRAEEALHRLSAIVESSDDAIIGKNLEGVITSWNSGAEKLYGYTTAEVLGRPVSLLVPDNHRDEMPEILQRLSRGEHIEHFESIRKRKDGKLVNISLNVSPIHDHAGKVVGASTIARDITEHKRAEEALLRSEKLASVGRMAATIAHEINNPLEAVVNSLYLALQDRGLPPQAREYLKVADEQLARVVHLTKQTLGFYRESRSHSAVRLPELMDDVLAFFGRKLADKHIAVSRRYDPKNGITAGTMGELRQVFTNMIANSIDALPEGGRLHVRVSCCPLPGNRMVRITVADTGRGIAPEHLGRIFEPFFTTKETIGTGLGLWITREIVQRHGGHVAVRTSPGKGTVFCIYLPAVQTAMAVSA